MIPARLVHNRAQMRLELVARDLLEPVSGGSMLHGTGMRHRVLGFLSDEVLAKAGPEALVEWLRTVPNVIIIPWEEKAS